jgi:oxygen-independent coproporphyrinogen-3 oxidase
MEQRRASWEGRSIVSVYLGGGTPSVLSVGQLERLFEGIRSRVVFPEGTEISVEMNPGSATREKCALLRSLGVTRVSIGVQSFSDPLLERLGRRHRAAEAIKAFRWVRDAGIASVGIDLLYGIPGQSREDWRATITTALELGPEHLSCYSLTIEQGPPLFARVAAGKEVMPTDDSVAEMYEHLLDRALTAGYAQYELSNFAIPSHTCRHNGHYWSRGDYLGLGPSASSCISDVRWTNVSSLDGYLSLLREGRSVVADEERITASEASAEWLFLGLRRTEGIDLRDNTIPHRAFFGPSFDEQVRNLSAAGLLENGEGRLRLTRRGMLLSNEIMARLIP